MNKLGLFLDWYRKSWFPIARCHNDTNLSGMMQMLATSESIGPLFQKGQTKVSFLVTRGNLLPQCYRFFQTTYPGSQNLCVRTKHPKHICFAMEISPRTKELREVLNFKAVLINLFMMQHLASFAELFCRGD